MGRAEQKGGRAVTETDDERCARSIAKRTTPGGYISPKRSLHYDTDCHWTERTTNWTTLSSLRAVCSLALTVFVAKKGVSDNRR